MKGLPNRSRTGASAPAPQPAPTSYIAAPQTPFNLFSNPTSIQSSNSVGGNPNPFGNSTTTPTPSFPPTNSPFSVKPARPTEAKPDAAPSSVSSSNVFAPANVSSAPSAFMTSSPSSFTIPSTTFPPTNTSKAFASLLSTSSSSTSTSSSNGSSDDSALKLYTNLRGLNVSLLSAVSKAVDDDAFVDLSSALEKYKEVRSKIQKGHDANPSATSGSKPSVSSSGDKPAMPAPPTSFTGFGGFNPATSTSSSTSAPAPPTFTFGSSSNTAFGSSSNTGFGSSSSTGFGSSTPSSPFGATSASTSLATATVPKPNSFGTASVPSSFKSFASTVAATTPSTFASSTTSSSTTTPSVGFTFGSGSGAEKPKEDAKTDTPNTEKKTLPFSFGTSPTPTSLAGTSLFGTSPPAASPSSTPKASTPAAEDGNAREGDEASTEGGESQEATPGLLAPNPHDEEGEGEENEETIHAVKSKAYRLKKDDKTGASSWAELGVGILRVKKDKTTASRRMLLRNSTNGKIHINFKIYVGMNPSVNKKAVSFVGHDNGVAQSYTLRVATEAQAKELKEAVEKEIEAIKAQ
ncbi:unnamed protein product [Cyclocybe aegerita]|uniref:RanBD1 domain-containing protein n=1 Tax=Cyclocybe aegerita TaxID=1973307 RepID=A0A8S0VU78_CYCAE|nr:unnamed protein product [Cyclocybe aegerita]